MNRFIYQISYIVVMVIILSLLPVRTTLASSVKRDGLFLSAGIDVGTSIFIGDNSYDTSDESLVLKTLTPYLGLVNFKVGYYLSDHITFFWHNRIGLIGPFFYDIESRNTSLEYYVPFLYGISSLGIAYYPKKGSPYSFSFSSGVAGGNRDYFRIFRYFGFNAINNSVNIGGIYFRPTLTLGIHYFATLKSKINLLLDIHFTDQNATWVEGIMGGSVSLVYHYSIDDILNKTINRLFGF